MESGRVCFPGWFDQVRRRVPPTPALGRHLTSGRKGPSFPLPWPWPHHCSLRASPCPVPPRQSHADVPSVRLAPLA